MISDVEYPMKIQLPKTDSIEELADFWDTHDVTEFEQEFEEVSEIVFTSASAGAGDMAMLRHGRDVHATE